MRVTTVFNRLMGLPATRVRAVNFQPDQITVTVRLTRQKLECPDCKYSTRASYDQRPKPSRWRHLDMCGRLVVIECSLRRVRCPNHGVRLEAVPFARPGTRVTRDVENLVVWCAKTMDWTATSVLCRVSWRTVNRIIERVVPTTADLSRIEGIVRIGVDEISWKRGHKYLTLVVDHDTGQVIWGAKGRRAVTLEAFFEQLGPDKTAQLEAISMDFGAPYAKATRENAPNAAICLDPFHAVAMATKALDDTRRDQWREMRKVDPDAAKTFKGTRFVLLKNPEKLTDTQTVQIAAIKRAGGRIWRAYKLNYPALGGGSMGGVGGWCVVDAS
ncbi:MAG: ISL3 family transposase [Candidatus Microthrix sp.]|nr:ISL3 family transposase [Candidatus Microthrix sp.]